MIGQLFLLLFLDLDLRALLTLSFLNGLFDLDLFLRLLPLLSQGHASLLHVVALDNLVVPEVLDFTLLVLLRLAEVGGNFLQIQSAVSFITVCHKLSTVTGFGRVLEFEVGDGLGSQVHLD